MAKEGMDVEKVSEALEKYKRYGEIQKENLEKMKRTFNLYSTNYVSSKNSEKMEEIQNKIIKDYTKLIEDVDVEIAEVEKQIELYKHTSAVVTKTVTVNENIK